MRRPLRNWSGCSEATTAPSRRCAPVALSARIRRGCAPDDTSDVLAVATAPEIVPVKKNLPEIAAKSGCENFPRGDERPSFVCRGLEECRVGAGIKLVYTVCASEEYSVVETQQRGELGPQAPAAHRGARTAPTRLQGQGILLLCLYRPPPSASGVKGGRSPMTCSPGARSARASNVDNRNIFGQVVVDMSNPTSKSPSGQTSRSDSYTLQEPSASFRGIEFEKEVVRKLSNLKETYTSPRGDGVKTTR
eukprot:1177578-Prorocentrum_minimum.AAC.4